MRPKLLGLPLLLLLLPACELENQVASGAKEPGGSFDTGDPPPLFETGDSAAPLTETCDGTDDDGDGEVDEGWPDADGDGVADCVDVDECHADVPAALSQSDEDCTGGVEVGEPPANPWDVVVEWQWTGGSAYSTPVVGDLDLDGAPEVVATVAPASYFPGDLIVFDGATGTVEWQLANAVDATGGVALGDLDLDGYGDIVTFNYSGGGRSVAAYDKDGNLMWQTSSNAREENYPVIVDLEGDGKPEVVVNEQILDGATGKLLVSLDYTGTTWGANAVADLDQDGVMEIMLENGVYEADGDLLFTCGTGGTGSFPQPVNIDSDDMGEVLIAGYGRMTLCDDDGTEIWTFTYGNYGTAVAVADFDDDGVQEYAFANTNKLLLIEPDGSTLWSAAMSDGSGLSGCTSWDIDLDGRNEVIFADEQDILVYNGTDGTIMLRDPTHASVTLAETPAVADVDGDGSGELVYASNGAGFGITVIGGADGDWPYAPTVYNQYTYYGANINEDLSVPKSPDAPWIYAANLFRGQPSAYYVAGSPNLQVQITDVCASTCDDGYSEVYVQVWNDGNQGVDAGVEVELWGMVSGSWTLVETRSTVTDIAGGGSEELLFVTTQSWLGTELYATVDARNLVEECHEDDNEGDWTDVPCAQ